MPVIQLLLTQIWDIHRLLQNQGPSYLNYASGYYLMLYESLPNCDWTCVYNQTSVDFADDSLNAAVNDAIAQSYPH
jgi:hypothetical protein